MRSKSSSEPEAEGEKTKQVLSNVTLGFGWNVALNFPVKLTRFTFWKIQTFLQCKPCESSDCAVAAATDMNWIRFFVIYTRWIHATCLQFASAVLEIEPQVGFGLFLPPVSGNDNNSTPPDQSRPHNTKMWSNFPTAPQL